MMFYELHYYRHDVTHGRVEVKCLVLIWYTAVYCKYNSLIRAFDMHTEPQWPWHLWFLSKVVTSFSL